MKVSPPLGSQEYTFILFTILRACWGFVLELKIDKFIEVVDIILLNKLLDNGKLSSNTGLLSSNFPLLDKLKVSTTFGLWINLSKFLKFESPPKSRKLAGFAKSQRFSKSYLFDNQRRDLLNSENLANLRSFLLFGVNSNLANQHFLHNPNHLSLNDFLPTDYS